MKEDITMEAELTASVAEAVEAESNIRKWPLSGPQKPVESDSPPVAQSGGDTPRLAADQLSLAVAGLLRMEVELAKLSDELVGPIAEEPLVNKNDRPGPILDRVRYDAKALAHLALRLDRRIRFIREKL